MSGGARDQKPGGKRKFPSTARLFGVIFLLASAIAAPGCKNKYKGGSELHARQVVLRREVEGLRQVAARLERHEPMMPQGDASVAITDSLVRDMIAAQLPLETDVDRFHVLLQEVDVAFRGSTVIRLGGTLNFRKMAGIKAQIDVIGALEELAVDPSGSTLSAVIVIDHLGIEKAAGLESVLGGSLLGEVSRRIRLEIKDRLPKVQIPIRVQKTIDFPAVTNDSVRIDGASLPLKISVSQVTAVRGRLWVALHFDPGEMAKTADAPEAADATAAATGFGLGQNSDETEGKAPAKAPGKGK